MRIQQLVGFPVRRDLRFRLFGRRYRVGASGVRALKLLVEAYDCFRHSSVSNRPFAARHLIKKIRRIDAKSTLCLVIGTTDNPTIRILAVWMRGHCGGTIGSQVLSQFCNDEDARLRREVARALKRMSAWDALGKMAQDCDPRVARMAISKTPKPFAIKFERFSNSVSSIDHQTSTGHLTLGTGVSLDHNQGKPPKSATAIRAILMRIKNLLSGNGSFASG